MTSASQDWEETQVRLKAKWFSPAIEARARFLRLSRPSAFVVVYFCCFEARCVRRFAAIIGYVRTIIGAVIKLNWKRKCWLTFFLSRESREISNFISFPLSLCSRFEMIHVMQLALMVFYVFTHDSMELFFITSNTSSHKLLCCYQQQTHAEMNKRTDKRRRLNLSRSKR